MPSTIHWPQGLPEGEVLPSPLRDGYGYTPRSTALSTDFGLVSRSRRIASDAPADVQVSFQFSASQWWYFEGFFRHALDDGTLFFWLPLVVAGVREEREVSFNGQTWNAMLSGYRGGRLTATLVTRQGTAMDADTWDVISGTDIDAYGELLAGFAVLANEDMPESIGA